MKISGRRLVQGEAMPKWYGIAYYDPCSDYQYCYPIPLNFFVRWWFDLCWWAKRGKEHRLGCAFKEGYKAGRSFERNRQYNTGFKDGRQSAHEELRREFKKQFGYDL